MFIPDPDGWRLVGGLFFIFVVLIGLANYWYWAVLTAEERKALTRDDGGWLG